VFSFNISYNSPKLFAKENIGVDKDLIFNIIIEVDSICSSSKNSTRNGTQNGITYIILFYQNHNCIVIVNVFCP
jgi:hypothetical protein